MDRLALVERLRTHAPEPRASGILSLSVFGSAARGDDTVVSDVDLAVRIEPAGRMSLLKSGSPRGGALCEMFCHFSPSR